MTRLGATRDTRRIARSLSLSFALFLSFVLTLSYLFLSLAGFFHARPNNTFGLFPGTPAKCAMSCFPERKRVTDVFSRLTSRWTRSSFRNTRFVPPPLLSLSLTIYLSRSFSLALFIADCPSPCVLSSLHSRNPLGSSCRRPLFGRADEDEDIRARVSAGILPATLDGLEQAPPFHTRVTALLVARDDARCTTRRSTRRTRTHARTHVLSLRCART